MPRVTKIEEDEQRPGGQTPNLGVKPAAGGSVGKDARFLNKLRRLLSKVEEGDRKLILYMAQKMANR